MRIVVALALLLAALTTGAPEAGAQTGVQTATLTHAGRWIVDSDGRVVIIHGVNAPSKFGPTDPVGLRFDEDDAAVLERAGLNAVRLTVERYAVEPTPGHFDDAYIARFGETIALLARHGIMSLVDFHQDSYGRVFFDNGFPDWMTITDGLPNLYQVGFPFQYLLNPALLRAFDHFWANDVGPSGRRLQDDDVEILARVARGLKDAPGLLGFEIMNEPWPGSVYPTCVAPVVGCPLFDRGPYSAYHAKAIAALRAADPVHMIWYEPLTMFNEGVPTSMVVPPDRRLGFSFHDYSLCNCTVEDALVLSNAVAHSKASGSALLQTEFGATFDTAVIGKQLALYDRYRMPWMFWSYNSYIVPEAAAGGALVPATDANINHTMLATLARPYPQLVAGTPGGWQFDPVTKTFTFRYTSVRAGGHGRFPVGAVTDIAVPTIAYPSGYVASITGGTITSAANAPILRIRSSRARGAIAVTITSR